ncbi:MAG: spore coat associated protein CotJA [Clostridia bacterium]|nr:spore coat associated protein CotJA [Clostridia bacterium]
MRKNENGYPTDRCAQMAAAGFAPTFNNSAPVTPGGNGNSNGNGGTVGGVTEGGCGCGGGSCVDNFKPAYLYAPSQKFCMLYSAPDALAHGTLFEQLYKPMEVYGNE